MPTVEDAIELALNAHRGQVDRAGEPYILHPLRIMAAMRDNSTRIAAVLHDVVEDSEITLDDLRRMGYDETIVAAVDCLSRRDGETYEAFIERLKSNPLAVTVKLGDLLDNMDIRRMDLVQPGDLERLRRYQKAWAELTKDERTHASHASKEGE